MKRAAAALAAAALVALTVSGCETTQEVSAKIGLRLGHQSAKTGTTRIGAANRSVRVVTTALIPGNPAAVALELTNTTARAQAAIPILIDVKDAKGAVVYRNDTKGIEVSIQQLALLGVHATAWWVDNEVLAGASAGATVEAKVGAAGGAPRAAPAITVAGVSASNAFPGPHVDVTLHNRGASGRSGLAVYAVAIRGGKVVGAGRALVPELGPGASAAAEIPMTGTVSGAKISITAAG